jgi:hypothetical protein
VLSAVVLCVVVGFGLTKPKVDELVLHRPGRSQSRDTARATGHQVPPDTAVEIHLRLPLAGRFFFTVPSPNGNPWWGFVEPGRSPSLASAASIIYLGVQLLLVIDHQVLGG